MSAAETIIILISLFDCLPFLNTEYLFPKYTPRKISWTLSMRVQAAMTEMATSQISYWPKMRQRKDIYVC